MKRAPQSVRPFLSRIFPDDSAPVITEGWIYGPDEAAIYGGYTAHEAVDFAVPLGTPVLAAADGLILASFEEVRIRYPGTEPRTWKGEPVYWGYGLFAAMLHDNGLLTFYGHLHRLSEPIWKQAYVAPLEYPNGDVASPITRLEARDFKKTYRSLRVKAGDIIGYSGITGMGMGVSTYRNWRKNVAYRANDEEHVHFAVCEPPAMLSDTNHLDPFGIYGPTEAYPHNAADWSQLPTPSLWLR